MNQPVTPITTKALILSLILIVVGMAIYFSGLDMSGGVQYIAYVIFFAAIIYSILQYGKQINHAATFGNYFSHGFRISAIVTVVMIIYVVVFLVLFPEFKDKTMEEARKNMQANNMTEEQLDQAMSISSKFFMTFAVLGTLIGYILLGVIASLIGAAVTKKNPVNFQQQTDQIS